jgi:hypothetical protein
MKTKCFSGASALATPRRTAMVEFTPHPGEEILRDGNWAADWTPAEANCFRT